MNNKTDKLNELKLQIKNLEQKKTTLTDADEIKAVNKQINTLQEELGRLRDEIKKEKAFAASVGREFNSLLGGD